jgi:hypothetical protein
MAMLAQRLHRKVVHQLHLAELDHDQIHIARPGAVGQLLPGGEHGLETQARVRQVEPPEGGPHQRRTAVGAHADAQLAQFQPLRERDVALQVARGAVELARMSEQQPAHIGGFDGAAVALQHRRADARLQRLDAARQRGLGQVHRLGGAAEAAVFDHGDQMAQLAQLHA